MEWHYGKLRLMAARGGQDISITSGLCDDSSVLKGEARFITALYSHFLTAHILTSTADDFQSGRVRSHYTALCLALGNLAVLWFARYMTDGQQAVTHCKSFHQEESPTSLSGLQTTFCHENTREN